MRGVAITREVLTRGPEQALRNSDRQLLARGYRLMGHGGVNHGMAGNLGIEMRYPNTLCDEFDRPEWDALLSIAGVSRSVP